MAAREHAGATWPVTDLVSGRRDHHRAEQGVKEVSRNNRTRWGFCSSRCHIGSLGQWHLKAEARFINSQETEVLVRQAKSRGRNSW